MSKFWEGTVMPWAKDEDVTVSPRFSATGHECTIETNCAWFEAKVTRRGLTFEQAIREAMAAYEHNFAAARAIMKKERAKADEAFAKRTRLVAVADGPPVKEEF
jgi:hypothetical protein